MAQIVKQGVDIDISQFTDSLTLDIDAAIENVAIQKNSKGVKKKEEEVKQGVDIGQCPSMDL